MKYHTLEALRTALENAHRANLTVLDPIPRALVQKSGTCAYFAMSMATDYWHNKEPSVPFFPARKYSHQFMPLPPIEIHYSGHSPYIYLYHDQDYLYCKIPQLNEVAEMTYVVEAIPWSEVPPSLSRDSADYMKLPNKKFLAMYLAHKGHVETIYKQSLRELGKTIVPTRNAVFDMRLFKKVLEQTGHFTGALHSYTSYSECLDIVKNALKAGFPIIFPIDLGLDGMPSLDNGAHAHYVLLVGLIESRRTTQVLYASHGSYYKTSLQRLYDSSMNLEYSPQKAFTKEGFYVLEPQRFFGLNLSILEATSLEQLKGKLVIPFPMNAQADYQKLSEEFRLGQTQQSVCASSSLSL
jgi:hypothetical protein